MEDRADRRWLYFFCQSAGFSEVETDVAKKRNQNYDFETCRCSVFTVSISSSSLFLCWVRQSVCNSVFDDAVSLSVLFVLPSDSGKTAE